MSSDPPLDGVALPRLHRLGGGKLVRRMIDLFLEHAPVRLASARAGLEGGDLEAVERAAHSLKSSAGNLGAQGVQRAAEAVERSAAEGDADGASARLAELERACGLAREALLAARAAHEE